MALGPRLDLRQSQSLVMTPQLQQAIKLLALSNLELETFIGQALEANPLLDAGDIRADDAPPQPLEEFPTEPGADSVAEGDAALDIDLSALDRDRDTGDGDWGDGDWGGALSAGGPGEEGLSIDERGAGEGPSLSDHLHAQIGAVAGDAREALIAATLIDLIDDAGYLTAPLSETADLLGVPLAEVERALALVQSLDPTGVGARTLAECIALQAKEAMVTHCSPSSVRLTNTSNARVLPKRRARRPPRSMKRATWSSWSTTSLASRLGPRRCALSGK